MAEVVWSQTAIDTIDQIVAYIAQFDPVAADLTQERLVRLGESLVDFPDRGRPAADGMREMVTVPPYILRYRTDGDHVVILSIRHSARHLDSD